MTERDRQRRLHVENRIAELNAKHGPITEGQLPDWLDCLEGYMARLEATLELPATQPEQPGEPGPVWDRAPL